MPPSYDRVQAVTTADGGSETTIGLSTNEIFTGLSDGRTLRKRDKETTLPSQDRPEQELETTPMIAPPSPFWSASSQINDIGDETNLVGVGAYEPQGSSGSSEERLLNPVIPDDVKRVIKRYSFYWTAPKDGYKDAEATLADQVLARED